MSEMWWCVVHSDDRGKDMLKKTRRRIGGGMGGSGRGVGVREERGVVMEMTGQGRRDGEGGNGAIVGRGKECLVFTEFHHDEVPKTFQTHRSLSVIIWGDLVLAVSHSPLPTPSVTVSLGGGEEEEGLEGGISLSSWERASGEGFISTRNVYHKFA